jgi:hypothetical protein
MAAARRVLAAVARTGSRDAFAWAYLACFTVTELGYTALTPHARAGVSAWASTSVASLEHEPAGPLVASAFVAPRPDPERPRPAGRLRRRPPDRGGHRGLGRLDVSAVGHLTAAVTAAAAAGLILARRGSARDVADAEADQVGDPGGEDPQYQLP